MRFNPEMVAILYINSSAKIPYLVVVRTNTFLAQKDLAENRIMLTLKAIRAGIDFTYVYGTESVLDPWQ